MTATPINYLRLAFPIAVAGFFILLGTYLVDKSGGDEIQFYIGWANIFFFSALILFAAFKLLRSLNNTDRKP